MMMEHVKKELCTWFEYMLAKYQWLNIKYEFSQSRKVWLVSFSPVSKIELSDEFNMETMTFEDEMNNKYGEDAPLFTDEEKLFKLSPHANILRSQVVDCYETAIWNDKKTMIAWSSSVASTSHVNYEPFQYASDYASLFIKVA